MRNPPVHWHEGLFLRPQHFQASDRYWHEHAHLGQRWDHPYHYGLYRLEFSKEALANYQLEIHTLKARMRDGTLIDLSAGQEPDRVDLRRPVEEAAKVAASLEDAFEKSAVVRAYLAAPKLSMGRSNVAGVGARDADARYQAIARSVDDDSRGGNFQDIELRSLNARILLSTQDLTGYEVLPIAQIRRAGEGEATPQIDPEYIPPLISCSAWPGLGRDILRDVFDKIGSKIEVLARQISDRGLSLASQDPGDADRILMLSQLNSASGALGALAFSETHPRAAYVELCRIAGQLSIFGPQRRIGELPPYDHEDLAKVFRFVKRRIEELINSVRDYEFYQRPFLGAGLGMQVTLEPQWFNADWRWCIGVRKGDLSDAECRELLRPGKLDWKFGSTRQVDVIFKTGAEGVELREMLHSIRSLPAQNEWIYYEVVRNERPAWRDVQLTQTLALRLRDGLIANKDKLQGQRVIAVSTARGVSPLEFALFAIPANK